MATVRLRKKRKQRMAQVSLNAIKGCLQQQTEELQKQTRCLAQYTEQMEQQARTRARQEQVLRLYYEALQTSQNQKEEDSLKLLIRIRESLMKDLKYFEETMPDKQVLSTLSSYIYECGIHLEDSGVEILKFLPGEPFDAETQNVLSKGRIPVADPELHKTLHTVCGDGYRRKGKMLKRADVTVNMYEGM